MTRLSLLVAILLTLRVALGQTPASPQATSKPSPPFVQWKTEKLQRVSGDEAVYPQIALTVHLEGCVYIQMTVASDGHTANLLYLSGPPLLMKSALDAVSTWKFTPSKQDISTEVAPCFFLPGDTPQKLLSSYQSAAEKHADAKNLTALAYELLLTGSPDDAAKDFRQVLDLKPGDVSAEFGLGDSLTVEGDLDGAVDAFQHALAAAPKNEQVRARLAESLQAKGDLDDAIVQYQTVLKSDPSNGSSRSNLAGLLLQTGDADGAIEQYKKALRDSPVDQPSEHYGLGQAYEKKGDSSGALKEYKEALSEMPQSREFQDAFNRLSSH